jgi:hypothetical protein
MEQPNQVIRAKTLAYGENDGCRDSLVRKTTTGATSVGRAVIAHAAARRKTGS